MVFRLGRPAQAAAASLLLFAAPVAAQTPAPPPQDTPLDPSSPIAELPGIGVAWPDLSAEPATPVDPQAPNTDDPAAERRYSFRIEGIDGVGSALLRQRFDELSALAEQDDASANAAQLDRRAREDAELLTNLLRAEGYYDAAVATRVEAGARPLVVLEAAPGALYKFQSVTLAGVEAAGAKAGDLQQRFGVTAGSPVDADAIVGGRAALQATLGREGFPFATVGEPDIVVDHATQTATLVLPVSPGGERRFGRITTNPNNRVFAAEHVAEIARFVPGGRFDQVGLDDLRRALIQTGLVSAVGVKPVPGANADLVDVAVTLEPAPPRTVAGELGYGTGEGARAELSWTHRNLFPPEGALTLRSVLGTREQLGAVIFRRANFRGRDRVLTGQIAAAHLRRDAFEARTFSLSGSLERQTNIFFQKTWTWSLGTELLASDERDVVRATGQARRRTFLIGALPTSLAYDGSDDLLNPQTGFRLAGRFSPELSLQGAAFGYSRVQLDGSTYRRVTPTVVLAGRARIGAILGAPRDQIAPSRRFYAGGGASVRGYGYQDIGPRDVNNDPIGGRSLAELSIEARVKAFGAFGVVPFLDAGNIYTSALPDFSGMRYGAGIGVRYYSNFGPIRIDVGTPINPQPGVAKLAVYVSLGQAF